MNLEKLCNDVRELVLKTADFIHAERESHKSLRLESKGKSNFVTHVDKGAEEMLVEGLSKLIPESGFIAEEGTRDIRGKEYNWIIDPIDGTTNFIHGVFPFAISVGLMKNEEIILGVIYELGLKECFYAWKDSPAYLNGEVIRVSTTPSVQDSLIATGFPYTNFAYFEEFLRSVSYFMEHSHGLRRLGSAATDIAYVACGRYDSFYEYGLSPWDVAAGVLIVRQAGGKVSDFTGGDDFLFGGEMIATNAKTWQEFQETIMKLMKP